MEFNEVGSFSVNGEAGGANRRVVGAPSQYGRGYILSIRDEHDKIIQALGLSKQAVREIIKELSVWVNGPYVEAGKFYTLRRSVINLDSTLHYGDKVIAVADLGGGYWRVCSAYKNVATQVRAIDLVAEDEDGN